MAASVLAGVPATAAAQNPVSAGQAVELLSHPGVSGPTLKLRGTLVHAGPDSVTVRVSEADRTVALADVAGLKVRRMERQTLLGATLGMATVWLINADDPEPDLAKAAGGAAIGAALGMLVKLPRYKKAPVSELRPDLLPGTVVRLQLASGPVTGTFVKASREQVIIETANRQRVLIPRQEVTRISWRSGKGRRPWALPVIFGAVGLFVGLTAANEPVCAPDAWLCMRGIETTVTGMTGLAIGTAVGTGISLMVPRPWRWEQASRPAPRLMLGPSTGGRVLVGVRQATRFR